MTITRPDDGTVTLDMAETAPGRFTATWQGAEPGLYRLRSGDLGTVAVLGAANPREFQRVVADSAPLAPLMDATGGGVGVLQQAFPSLRRVDAGRIAFGRGWLGITRREAYVTTDLRLTPFLPAWAWLLLGLGLFVGAWLREARR